jgi:Protein of unknown function (DUF3124)
MQYGWNPTPRHVDAEGAAGAILPPLAGTGAPRGLIARRPIVAGVAMPEMSAAMRLCVSAMVLALGCIAARAETAGTASQSASDFCAQFKHSLMAMPDQGDLSVRGTIFVPAYSRVYGASAGEHKLIELSTTLRIDNTSETKPLVIEGIEYYDTAGKLVQSYLKDPVALRPFGSVEIVIPAEDDRGGAAANFVVRWAGVGPIAEPRVEAVMIGSQDNTSYSFVSPGHPIHHVGRSAWPQFRFRF